MHKYSKKSANLTDNHLNELNTISSHFSKSWQQLLSPSAETEKAQ